MIKISPDLLKKLNELFLSYGFDLKHSVLNDLGKKTENHRYTYLDKETKITVEAKYRDE